MKEREINEKRNWKGTVFPYDNYFPDESEECNYCLTYKQAEILRGIIEPLGWETRWFSDTQSIDKDEIEQFRNDIIGRLMMSCCGNEAPLQYRWTDDGILQQSEDGGETWVDAPLFDPRNNSPVYPPIPGEITDDTKCIAANSVVTLIKEQVGDQLTDDMGRYTLGQLVHDWITTYIDTSNPFEALITIAANQIFALVISALRTALTDDVYNDLQCIIYCHMGEGISFDDSQWTDVRTQIQSDITGIAGVFLEHLIFLLGKIGLTNLARSQASTEGDCTGCSCEGGCDISGWELWDVDAGIINTGTRTSTFIEIAAQIRGDSNYYVIFGNKSNADGCCVLNNNRSDTKIVYAVGNPDFAWYSPCGTDFNNLPFDHPLTLGNDDESMNGIMFKHGTPFTLQINTSD